MRCLYFCPFLCEILKWHPNFKICSSWRFQNTPYMLNLMKVWLRYLTLKNLFCFFFVIANYLSYFCIQFKDQRQICNLLVMRISKLSLIIEIDEELTEIFKVKDKAQFPKRRWKHESYFCCCKGGVVYYWNLRYN